MLFLTNSQPKGVSLRVPTSLLQQDTQDGQGVEGMKQLLTSKKKLGIFFHPMFGIFPLC